MTISSLTIDSVREGLLARRFSARELAVEALRFAEAENPKTSAYLLFSPERALASADSVDRILARGEDPGPLAGVPLAVLALGLVVARRARRAAFKSSSATARKEKSA